MKPRSKLAGILLLVWMAVVIIVFGLVMVPAESSLARVLPSAFWEARSAVYTLFYSPSVYE